MELLNNSKINCPKPLKTINGNYLIKLKNKTACIVSFLNGKDKKKLNSKNCFEIGKVVAQMHLVTKKMETFPRSSSCSERFVVLRLRFFARPEAEPRFAG